MALPVAAAGASWLAANASWLIPSIISALGMGASALGLGKGKKLEYEPQISPQEQALRAQLMSYFGEQYKKPATRYPGSLFDPMTMMGMNIMSSVYGKTPYQGSQFALPQTKFAQGGIVTQPTNALLGEAGPEMIIPLRQRMMGMQPGIQTPFQGLLGQMSGQQNPLQMNPQMMQQMWPLIQMMMGRR